MRKITAADRELLEAKAKMKADLERFEQATASDEEREAWLNAPRENVETPPEIAKSRENPHGIVDIMTFARHPFFLNLTPTPWQGLILKCFYAGSAGNTHLRINDVRPAKGCDGCVWEGQKKSEERFLETSKGTGSVELPMLILENSPCVQCTRWDKSKRAERYQVEIDAQYTDRKKEEVRKLADRPAADKFHNEDDMLHDDELDPEVSKQIRDKFGLEFQELLLVCGRRSGKSFICCVVALYEAYKLIMMGNPQREFRLLEGNNMAIYNVAVSENQARDAIFNPLSSMLSSSPFFTPYIGKAVDLEFHLLTPHDIEFNKKAEANGGMIKARTGTVHIVCGHSNAKSLVGRTMVVVIIDELAAMAGEDPDKSLDKALYDDLKPSVATFGRLGKIVCLSNPKGPVGLLYKLFEDSFGDDTMLMFQLPTWKTNPKIEQSYLDAERRKDPYSFAMQFGAQFGTGGAQPFLPPDAVKEAFESSSRHRRIEVGLPLVRYFAHLDPAQNSDDYVLVICHAESMEGKSNIDGSQMMRVVVDHIQIFRAASRLFPISVEEVDNYLLGLASGKFRFAQISYDHFDSSSSIQKMQAWNLPALRKQFTPEYKRTIYQELFDLFTQGRIEFYRHDTPRPDGWKKELVWVDDIKEAKNQFLGLQRKLKRANPVIEALKGGKDDICDAVAAASYEALKQKVYNSRPRARSAYIGGGL